jgi:HEAT repeat protein
VLGRVEKDPNVINEIIEHLSSDIRSIKFNAILVLGELGEKSSSGISQLVKCLEDNDWSVCREAVRSLGKIGNVAERSVSEISKLIKNKEPSIRKEAAIALGKIGYANEESISSLIDGLKDVEEDVRNEAAIALGKIGSGASEAISHLINVIKDSSWQVRTEAVKSLSKIGTEARNAVPSLLKALGDKDWRVRKAVTTTLAKIGASAIPSLLKYFNHYNPIIRKGVAETLAEMRIPTPEVLTGLSLALKDKDKRVRARAADALRSIGKDSVPILLNAFEKSNEKMQKVIISALGGIGTDAKEVIPILSNILRTREVDTEYREKRLYSKSSFTRVKLAFSSLFKEKKVNKVWDLKLRNYNKITNLGLYIMLLTPFIYLLSMISLFLTNPYWSSFIIAALIVLPVGMLIFVIGLIIEFLKQRGIIFYAKLHVEVVRALGNIGMDSEEAISALKYALLNRKYVIRRVAALSLGKLGTSASSAIPSLIKALNDKKPDVRWRASEALGLIGISTEDVIPSLNSLIHDKCDYVCEAAIIAIEKIKEK